jgi:quaternary ammonium compound-resistance protein SugE
VDLAYRRGAARGRLGDRPEVHRWLYALGPSLVTGVAMLASLYFLALAVRTIPIGTGYAVWTGIGAVGVAILGMILFHEPRDLLRVGSILLIVAGIAGLKLVSP